MEEQEGESAVEGEGRFCTVNVRRTPLCSTVFQRTCGAVGLKQLKTFVSDITL